MAKQWKVEHLLEVKKEKPGLEINFAFSNMEFLLENAELPFERADILLHGANADARVGSRDLIDTLSRREAVPPENIFLTMGSSHANFVLCAILLNRGDEVLIETPVYEPLYRVPEFLGAKVRFVARDPNDFSLAINSLEEALGPKTKMIILTDSHNPSGNQLGQEILQFLQEACRRGIHVLIDEVYARYYREESLFCDYPEFMVTSSLSKFYGLGSLRAGWAFAPAVIVERALDFDDLITPEIPFPPLHLTNVLLNSPVFATLQSRIRERIKKNRKLVISFFNETPHVTAYIPRNGVLFFPELPKGTEPETFYSLLLQKYRMVVTPGKFFRMPNHFRFAAIWSEGVMKDGLRRLGLALAETTK
jgi:hypothetical protein